MAFISTTTNPPTVDMGTHHPNKSVHMQLHSLLKEKSVEFRKPWLCPQRPPAKQRIKAMTVEAPIEFSRIETPHIEIKQSCNPNYTSSGAYPIQAKPILIKKDAHELVASSHGDKIVKHNSILVVQRTRSFRRRVAHVKSSMYKFPKTVEKRNARERTRVHTVNQAFLMLKYRIPSIKSNAKRVSKLKILRAAINYIYSLSDLLEKAPQISQSPHIHIGEQHQQQRLATHTEFISCPQPTSIPKPIVDLSNTNHNNNNNNAAFIALPYMGYENLALTTHFNCPQALSQAALDQLCYPNYPLVNNFVNTNFI